MNYAIVGWALLTLMMGFLAWLAIWARTGSRARGLSVLCLLAFSPLTAAVLAFALGMPVPLVNGITAPSGKWVVLGQKLVIDQGIYLLLDTGDGKPTYYYLPWNAKMASALQESRDNKDSGGTQIEVPDFEYSWDQHTPQIWDMPQPKVLPDKPQAAPAGPHTDI